MLVHLKDENFDELVKGKKVLVDFYADWCGPCKMLSPVLEKIGNDRDDVLIVKVNSDTHSDLANKFGVRSIPALFVLDNGKQINQAVGYRPEAKVLEMLE